MRRATTKPRSPTTVCFFPSIRAPRNPVGVGYTTKASLASSKAVSPVRIRNSCSKNSTLSCPSGRHGKLKIKKTTKNTKSRESHFLCLLVFFVVKELGRIQMTQQSDIGLVGLAVMGENLALNIESRGYSIAVYNRTTSKVDELIAGRAKGKKFVGCHSLEDLVDNLAKPRKVMMMVTAGPAVDDLIETLLPLLEKGDILIDGGNTYYADTERRTKYVEGKGLLYVGTGV